MLVVELYDPLTPTYKFVRSVFLYKNADFEPFIKSSNSVDFIRDSSFATNGQVLMIQTNLKDYYFDLKTGVRINKNKFPAAAAEGGESLQNYKITYDYQNNVFYAFKHSQANTKLEVMQIVNFKKGGVSHGFSKNYLSNRLNEYKTSVFGDAPNNDGKIVAPNKLNLIQRIMKNVTTPVLI